jgi:hypothetical protein
LLSPFESRHRHFKVHHVLVGKRNANRSGMMLRAAQGYSEPVSLREKLPERP